MKTTKLIYALKGMYSLGYNSVSAILPAFLANAGVLASRISMIPASYSLARFALAPAIGHASDRFGHRKALAAAAFVAAAMAVCLFYAKSVFDYSLVFFIVGISSGLFYLSLDAIATTISDRKGHVLGYLETSYLAGLLAGPIIGGALAANWGMDAAFAFWACAALATAFAAFGIGKRHGVKKAGGNGILAEMPDCNENGKFMLAFFAIATAGDGFLETGVALAVPIFAVWLGFNIVSVGLIMGIASGIAAIGVPQIGKLSDIAGRMNGVKLSFALMLAACVALSFSTSFAMLAVFAGVFMMGRSSGYATTRAFVSDISSGRHRASALSVHDLFFNAGRFLGPVAAGLMLDFAGAPPTFIAFGALPAIVIAGSFLVKKE